MKLIKFYESSGTCKVRVDTLDDLWTIQRVIFPNDIVKALSDRRFKPTEGDVGELKKVMITLMVEKTELDKSAERLRIMGKIKDGKPLEFVKLNSYHTLNIAPGDDFEISKTGWPDYLIGVVKNAVSDTKKPRLGIIVLDDEKALPAYMLGYGVEFKNEIYSKLSKRMTPKDFQEAEKKYFDQVIDMISKMNVDTVVLAGPGFTREDIKKYGTENGALKKISKEIIYESVSNPERSGVYELIRGDKVAKILEKERIRQEFRLMEEFLTGLGTEKSKYGIENVSGSIESSSARRIIVNDDMLGNGEVQKLLSEAEKGGIDIEVFNSVDEVGAQLKSFKGIACLL